MKKVLIISCSPRLNGNTEILLKESARGVADAGGTCDFVRLAELNISPCIECGACLSGGNCAVEDDMTSRLVPELGVCDALIFGSPIFFMSITAQGKAFVDRCQPLWVKKFILKQQPGPLRKGAFISVSGSRAENTFDCATRVVKSFFAVSGFEYSSELFATGLDAGGEALASAEFIRQSYELGTDIAERISA